MARTIALCGLWCGCRLLRVPAIRLCGLRYRQGVSASRGVSWINTRVLERLIQGLFTNSIGLPPEANIHKEKGQITPAETKQPQRKNLQVPRLSAQIRRKTGAISLAKSCATQAGKQGTPRTTNWFAAPSNKRVSKTETMDLSICSERIGTNTLQRSTKTGIKSIMCFCCVREPKNQHQPENATKGTTTQGECNPELALALPNPRRLRGNPQDYRCY